MTSSSYSAQRMWLHWVSAVVIIWTLASGFYVASFNLRPGIEQCIAFINVSLTTVFIPFFVWRVFIYVSHARRASVRALPLMKKLAHCTHATIYLNIAIVLITGVLMMNRPIDVFGMVDIPQPLSDPQWIALFVTVHVWACVLLSLLIMLHVGAVIFHEACGHRILRRMSWCRYRRSEHLE